MNAGSDYTRAKRQAQANADYTGCPRWIWFSAGIWWVEGTPHEGAERIDPARSDPHTRAHQTGAEHTDTPIVCAGCGRDLTEQTAQTDDHTGDTVCATCRMDREDFRRDHPHAGTQCASS